MRYKVLDTNIPLLDHNNIINLMGNGVIIVLPETTLDELVAKKSGLGELAYQSRRTTSILRKCTRSASFMLGNNNLVSPKTLNEHILWTVSLLEYPSYENVDNKIINDRKIIEVAAQLTAYFKLHAPASIVELVTNDYMCEERAIVLGVNTSDFKIVDKVDYEFTKTLEVSDEVFRNLHGKRITDIDKDHKVEHYNYKFTTPESEQVKIATINNETITILGKETEADLRKQDVNPQGADQLLLSKAILDPTVNLVVCEALAGSGKTLVSLSNAIRLIKDRTNSYSSIIYVRSSINDVEKIEEVGFLPGDAAEKNAVYFHPLMDSLDFIARSRMRDPRAGKVAGEDFEMKIEEKIAKMMTDYSIIPMTGLGMRGRTFKDTVFIYDEVQNASKPSLQKALTRIGKNCKVILIGSNKQIDNPNMTKFTNGLSVILNDCATQVGNGINKHVVNLHRVIRSDFAEYAERLFSKER